MSLTNLLKKLTSRNRSFRYYESNSFLDMYSGCISDEIFLRCLNGGRVKIYDDEIEEIRRNQAEHDEFNRKLGNACCLNNEGLELERAGDIAGAIAKYEENILSETYFTLNPYHRLCVLYRRVGDYDNEIRVIETCLSRKELPAGRERDFFEDRLLKARTYQSSKTK